MNKPPNTPPVSCEDECVPEHIFRLVVEQTAMAISITDERSNILYANPAFLRTTGYSKSQILGQNQSLLSYRVTPKLVYETMWAQIKRQRAWNGLLVNKRYDGSRYLADLTISPVINEAGITTHYLGMHRDVTEVHRLERQVQNQKSLIESVIDAAQVAIALLDDNDRVLLDNQEYKKLIGDLGKEPAVLLLASVRAQMGNAFVQAQSRHHNIAAREVCVELPKRAARWFSCSISWFEEQDVGADAFYEPRQKYYLLLTIADISELKRQQEALRINSLRALLSEQERIQGLRETLAGVVYQLEEPFNVLSAVTHMLERRLSNLPSDPLQAKSVWGDISATALDEAMQKSREALETLRACIPDHSSEVWQRVNLNEILTDVLKLSTTRLLAANIVVDWQPDVTLSEANGQPVQLSNLFKHLIGNAIEAFNEQRGSHREIRIKCLQRPDCIEVYIEDSGPGINDALRFKVFEPFFTTKGAAQQHLGLGLAMAQDVVTRHGGCIDIDPAYRNGCRVRVQLPVIAGDEHVS
jgi:nitrogen fixation negative regulator NifL